MLFKAVVMLRWAAFCDSLAPKNVLIVPFEEEPVRSMQRHGRNFQSASLKWVVGALSLNRNGEN